MGGADSGKSVSNNIILASDVLKMRVETKDVFQVVGLARRGFVRPLVGSFDEWLVVRVDCERTAFKDPLKVFDSGVDCEQLAVVGVVVLLGGGELPGEETEGLYIAIVSAKLQWSSLTHR